MTCSFVDISGRYISSFDGAVPYPEGAVAIVESAPDRADMCWNGAEWVPCEPSIDEQLASIEASFDAKKLGLAEQLSTVMLVEGPAEATKITELKAAYVAACNEKAAAIDALLFGEL